MRGSYESRFLKTFLCLRKFSEFHKAQGLSRSGWLPSKPATCRKESSEAAGRFLRPSRMLHDPQDGAYVEVFECTYIPAFLAGARARSSPP